MAEVHIEPARAELVPEFVAALRTPDVYECWRLANQGPSDCLLESIAMSRLAFAGWIGGEPAAMWGLARPTPLGGTFGVPWLLSCTGVDRYPLTFARESRRWVAQLRAIEPNLCNFIDPAYARAIRWVRWLGFDVEERDGGLVVFGTGR